MSPDPGNEADGYVEDIQNGDNDTSLDGNLDDGNLDDNEGNRISGAMAQGVLEHLVRSIVEFPDAVIVDVEENRGGIMLRLHVDPEDMGRVIGRRGRVATAVRTVVRAAGAREGVDARVDIVD